MTNEIIPNDILNQIQIQFEENYDIALELILSEFNFDDFLNKNRILRCVLYLSENNIEKLKTNINFAKIDYRDVILWAEYDLDSNSSPVLVRDFSKPFKK